jgi:hypothetical protein
MKNLIENVVLIVVATFFCRNNTSKSYQASRFYMIPKKSMELFRLPKNSYECQKFPKIPKKFLEFPDAVEFYKSLGFQDSAILTRSKDFFL